MTPGIPQISLCMIVKNEQENLPDCLAAARALTDELVVVDTGSSDSTQEIVRQAGGILIETSWKEDFSIARNLALQRATGTWVLVLDADEVLGSFDEPSLRNMLANTNEEAFTLEIQSLISRGNISTAPITRLFRSRPEHRYQGRIHEQILPAICKQLGRPELEIKPSGLFAQHSGYLPEVRHLRKKDQRNENLLRLMVNENPEDGHALYLLGKELSQSVGGDFLRTPATSEAAQWLDRAWSKLRKSNHSGLEDLAVRRLRHQIIFHKTEVIDQDIDEVKDRFATSLMLRFLQGELAFYRKNFGKAKDYFDQISDCSQPTGFDLDSRYAESWPKERMARCLVALGEFDQAEKLISMNNLNSAPGLLMVLSRISLAKNDAILVIKLLLKACKASPHDPRPHLEMHKTLTTLGQPEAATNSLAAALRLAPGWEDALLLMN